MLCVFQGSQRVLPSCCRTTRRLQWRLRWCLQARVRPTTAVAAATRTKWPPPPYMEGDSSRARTTRAPPSTRLLARHYHTTVAFLLSPPTIDVLSSRSLTY